MINEKLLNSLIKKYTTYKTTEQKIGTWVDGKDVYRKVFIVNSPSFGTDYDTGITADTMIKMDCVIKSSETGQVRNLPWLYGQNQNTVNGAWAGGFYMNNNILRFQAGQELMKI